MKTQRTWGGTRICNEKVQVYMTSYNVVTNDMGKRKRDI